jgi:hypothetical protein
MTVAARSAKVQGIRELAEQQRAEVAGAERVIMSESDAEWLTDKIAAKAAGIRNSLEDLKVLVDEAKAGNAHLALGYPSWTAYLAATLGGGQDQMRLPRVERRELVGYLTGEGMSTRAIGVVAGVSEGTVRNDLRTELASFPKPGAQNYAPAEEEPAQPPMITGRDGKEYPRAPKPETEPEGDFMTPTVIVDAAREAMGGIDLDPASNLKANDVHKIPMYFDRSRSAFDHAWFGRVWLNPPFGDWAPWFEQIIHYWDSQEMTQLCMLSPACAFATRLARPIMERAAAMILLSPTPKFSGNVQGGTGTNLPHMIMYFGPRVGEFVAAFGPFGAPFVAPKIGTPG